MALEFTDSNFEKEVLESSVPVLVDFWAAWCGPCHALSPTIEKLAGELTGAKVGKVNIDENQQTTANYNVSAIPTVLVFKDGKPVSRFVGLQKEAVLREAVEKAG